MLDRVKQALFFAILADECRYSSGKEQLALFFRYVHFDDNTRKFSVHEDFVKFLHCPRTSGEALFEILKDFMAKKGIPMENGRGQGYDGGGNMSLKHKRLQARVTSACPKTHYHLCDAH